MNISSKTRRIINTQTRGNHIVKELAAEAVCGPKPDTAIVKFMLAVGVPSVVDSRGVVKLLAAGALLLVELIVGEGLVERTVDAQRKDEKVLLKGKNGL